MSSNSEPSEKNLEGIYSGVLTTKFLKWAFFHSSYYFALKNILSLIFVLLFLYRNFILKKKK